MFMEGNGEVFRVLGENAEGKWLISYDYPCAPKFVIHEELKFMNCIEPPKEFQKRITEKKTPGQEKERD